MLSFDQGQIGVQLLSEKTEPNDIAYIIYTSGSTGKPKGIVMPHRGFSNAKEALAELKVEIGDKYLQFAPSDSRGLCQIYLLLYFLGLLSIGLKKIR